MRWSALDGGNGMNGQVWATTVFDDGSGPALHAGGGFGYAGGVVANRIAKWNGAQWSPLGSGMNEPVYALTVFDDGTGPGLYAGGDFTKAEGVVANYIAKWNGKQWSPLGSGMNNRVYSLTVFDDGSGAALYAGGAFVMAGGIQAYGIAKWDGIQWSPVGGGIIGPGVYALTVFDDGTGPALYAGGWFTRAGGLPANYIAKWDGKQWSALGSGTNGLVYALTGFDDGTGPALYAGGGFTMAGGMAANRIAKWDGAQWSPLGSGIVHSRTAWVYALTVFDDGTGPALYAGGIFTIAGGIEANRVAKWDGGQWLPLGSGINNGAVFVLTEFDDGMGPRLFAGGGFTLAGGHPSSAIAAWHCVWP